MSYRPTSLEKKKAREYILKYSPSEEIYSDYKEWIEVFREDFQIFLSALKSTGAQHENGIREIGLRKSALFKKKYLVAYVKPEWLKKQASECDAIASNELILLGGFAHAPPLVLISENQKGCKDAKFRSIMEHEFVHVNQALMGSVSPSKKSIESADDLLKHLFETTRNEYEANYIQLVNWPSFYPHKEKISLEGWCVLRGYTQGLEQALEKAAVSHICKKEIIRFLALLPKTIPSMFKTLGFNELLSAEYVSKCPDYVSIATAQIFRNSEKLSLNKEFIMAMHEWGENELKMEKA